MTEIHVSVCDSRFQAVVDAFARGFEEKREVGAALAVYQHGESVVDLHAGHRDRRRKLAWQPDTLCCFFSISKALTTTLVLRAIDRGQLHLDATVRSVWPEFGSASTNDVTLRQVLSHQAGLPAIRQPLDKDAFYRWDDMCAALSQEEAWWKPGQSHGYHARTLGFLLGEVYRRGTGETVRSGLAQLRKALNCELYFGLETAQLERCADMLPARVDPKTTSSLPADIQAMLVDFTNTETVTGATFQNPRMRPGYMNAPEFRQATIPAVNGHGAAAGVAKFMNLLPTLVSENLLQEAATVHSLGPDRVLKSTTCFGLGYMLHDDKAPLGWRGCIGHAGAGGSMAFYDPQADIGFAYVMNQMQEGVVTGGTSAALCAQVVHECLT